MGVAGGKINSVDVSLSQSQRTALAIPDSCLGKSKRPPEKFQQFFRQPISDQNRAEVEDYLRDAERDYRECQAEINKYKALVLILESQKEGMEKTMQKYRSLVSPVHRLPSDLLLEIFGQCCEVNVIDDQAMPPAMALTMVCGRWREIALSSPRLWSSISLDLCNFRDHSAHRRITHTNLTALFLERSKMAPLKVRIHLPPDYTKEDRYSKYILDIIESQSERWEELEVFGSEFYAASQAGDIDLPILRHLTFHAGSSENQSHDRTIPLDRFKSCPSLTSLSTDVTETEPLELPWANLRVVTLQGGTIGSALTVLELCSSLECLTLVDVYGVRGRSFDNRTVVSNTLKTLSIQGEDGNPSIIEYFTFPHLSSIDLDYITNDASNSLKEMIQRSACSITSLALYAIEYMTDSDLISLLSLIPTLENLHIEDLASDCVVTRCFLDHLTVNLGDYGVFLPHLRELSLELLASRLEGETLSKALTSRCLPTIPSVASAIELDCLEAVTILLDWSESDDPSPELSSSLESLSPLEYLRDIGLRLTISHQAQ
ncbi:hypothetical protein PQX77_021813 [Marasmius sp. AFHP31]|nr:hypothetical protein PQX77_021813 [Marasmius sp. AFHP31]